MAIERAWVSELEINMTDANLRRMIVEEWTKKLEVEAKATRAAKDQAIEEYKWSKDFKDEMVEGCLESLHLGFFECNKKVR